MSVTDKFKVYNTNFAGNSHAHFKCLSKQYSYEIQNIMVWINCDATVASRYPHILYYVKSDVCLFGSSALHPSIANNQRRYSWAKGLSHYYIDVENKECNALPQDLILKYGEELQIWCNGGVAGDAISLGIYYKIVPNSKVNS